MYHYVHLADHRDIAHAPHAFLDADDDYRATDHDARGNRMRASDWRAIFNTLPKFCWHERTRPEAADRLPKQLAERFRAYDRDDLAITHYSIWGTAN